MDELVEDQNVSFQGIENLAGHHASRFVPQGLERKGGPDALWDRHGCRSPECQTVDLPDFVRLEDKEGFSLGPPDRIEVFQDRMNILDLVAEGEDFPRGFR